MQYRVAVPPVPMEPSPDSGLAPDWVESSATSELVDFAVARPLLLSKREEAVGKKVISNKQEIVLRIFEKEENSFYTSLTSDAVQMSVIKQLSAYTKLSISKDVRSQYDGEGCMRRLP